jgi:hypothetical protein
LHRRASVLLILAAIWLAGCSGSLVTASDLAALATPAPSPTPGPVATPTEEPPTPEPTPTASPTPEPTAAVPVAESPDVVLAAIEGPGLPRITVKTVIKHLRSAYKAHPEIADVTGPVGLRRSVAEGEVRDCLTKRDPAARPCRLFLSIWLFGPYQTSFGGAAFRGSAYELSGFDPVLLRVGTEVARDWVKVAGSGVARWVRQELGLEKR